MEFHIQQIITNLKMKLSQSIALNAEN